MTRKFSMSRFARPVRSLRMTLRAAGVTNPRFSSVRDPATVPPPSRAVVAATATVEMIAVVVATLRAHLGLIRDISRRQGYSLSKPGGGPALYWHRDWHHWSCKAESEQPRGTQLFLMVYLVDTTPDNGCLRVIPRSHL